MLLSWYLVLRDIWVSFQVLENELLLHGRFGWLLNASYSVIFVVHLVTYVWLVRIDL